MHADRCLLISVRGYKILNIKSVIRRIGVALFLVWIAIAALSETPPGATGEQFEKIRERPRDGLVGEEVLLLGYRDDVERAVHQR